jgi:hypothetical protein
MVKIETENKTLLVNPSRIASISIWEGSNHMTDRVHYKLALNYGGTEESCDLLSFKTESDRDQALNKLVIN